MTNKTKIALISGLILVAIAGYMLFMKNNSAELKQFLDSTSTTTPINTASEIPSTSSDKKPIASDTSSIKEKSWSVLQQYLKLAKAHDIVGVSSLSYQISDSCKKISESEAMKKDCNDRMDTVYTFGSQFKKEDFVYVWSDSKQIILSTDWTVSDEQDFGARMRSIIFFVIDNKGDIKVLSFKPTQGTLTSKFMKVEGESDVRLTDKEVSERLIQYTEDKDQDGIEDFVETCSGSSDNQSCTKTNPTKRDTDGNGYWDGVQALFYK